MCSIRCSLDVGSTNLESGLDFPSLHGERGMKGPKQSEDLRARAATILEGVDVSMLWQGSSFAGPERTIYDLYKSVAVCFMVNGYMEP